ncbi:hypothetical protein ACIBLA_10265 [Streptomyces sp. NPDC050433]|uniref:hypothetical protein n=1 Tax=Streptomyces sp. NPDC050433 TaxID=3365615 RepID=UPI0037AF78C6
MSSHRQQGARRRARIAGGAALLLVVETALIAGASLPASAAPAPESGAAKAVQQSKADNLASVLAWAAKHAKGSIAGALTEAKKTGKKVVVTDETTELTAGPERVWKSGRWQKADAALVEAPDGSVTAKAHPGGLRLGGKGGTPATSLRAAQGDSARDLVTLGSGESQVTLQWKGGLPKPELDGTRARYHNAVPGADVIVEATRTGFEQFVEINERPTGAYTYTLPVKARA